MWLASQTDGHTSHSCQNLPFAPDPFPDRLWGLPCPVFDNSPFRHSSSFILVHHYYIEMPAARLEHLTI